MLWFYVLVRILANPLSNVFQKLLTQKKASPLFVVSATHGLLSLVCLPILIVEPPPEIFPFWFDMTLCTILAISGNMLLVQAVQMSDLSILGPVNAYKSVVSILPGVIFLNEILSQEALLGIMLIVAGSYFLVDKAVGKSSENVFIRFFKDRGVQYRIAALVLSAIEAVFLKRALLHGSPITTFALWSVLGWVLSIPILLFLKIPTLVSDLRILRENWLTYLLLAVTTGLMQLSTLITFTGFQVAGALALFQTSSLVSVLLGWQVFREQNIAKRLIGSVIMVLGAILIVLHR